MGHAGWLSSAQHVCCYVLQTEEMDDSDADRRRRAEHIPPCTILRERKELML